VVTNLLVRWRTGLEFFYDEIISTSYPIIFFPITGIGISISVLELLGELLLQSPNSPNTTSILGEHESSFYLRGVGVQY